MNEFGVARPFTRSGDLGKYHAVHLDTEKGWVRVGDSVCGLSRTMFRRCAVPRRRTIDNLMKDVERCEKKRGGSVCRRCLRLIQRFRNPLDRLAEL